MWLESEGIKTMSNADVTRTTMIEALARVTRKDVAAVEFLALREVMGWVFSDENPGAAYGRHHASMLGGALFTGLDDAAGVDLAHQPDETPAMDAARDRFVEGAHELASHGEAGLSMLIEDRVIPAMIGELERTAGELTTQGAYTWVYLLYAVAMGERHDQDEQVMSGFFESFDAWSATIAAL